MQNSKAIETFLAYLRDAEQQYNMAKTDEQEANDATQDLLHELELRTCTYHEHAQISKKLAAVRQIRRRAKDIMDETAPVLTWIDENQKMIKSLEQLLGDVRKAERNTANRIYTPRTNINEK